MLHGIEELCKDSQGFVYWRGRHLEHFSYDDQQEEALATQRLAAICLHCEQIGVEVSMTTAVFFSDWFADMAPNDPYKNLLVHLCCYEVDVSPPNKIAFVGLHGLGPITVLYFDGTLWHRIKEAEYGGSAALNETWGYHRMQKEGWLDHPLGGVLINIPREHFVSWLKEQQISPTFLDESEGGPWCKDPGCWICSRENWTLQPDQAYPPLLTIPERRLP